VWWKLLNVFFFFSVYPIWCSFLYYLPFSWMYSEMFPHDGTEKREPWTTATRHAKVERKDSWINIYLKREKKKLKFPFRILFFFLPSSLHFSVYLTEQRLTAIGQQLMDDDEWTNTIPVFLSIFHYLSLWRQQRLDNVKKKTRNISA